MFKNLTKKRLTVLLVSLSLILVVGVGVTLAYVFASTGNVVNTFTPSHVSCAVVENNSATENTGNPVNVESKSNVMIKNTGDTEAYIRVAVIVNWKNNDGHVWATAPKSDEYTIIYDTSNPKWVKLASDNFWYYTAPVSHIEGSNLTDVLIKSATQIKPGPVGTDGSQYYLSIEIVASAIQSTPANVVGDNWSNDQVKIGVDANRYLTFTNKQGGTQ